MATTLSFGTRTDQKEELDQTGSISDGSTDKYDEPTTKTCPRCGAELFSDMDICYDCLYDFTRLRPQGGEGLRLDEQDELTHERGTWDEGMESMENAVSADTTMDISLDSYGVRVPDLPSLRVRCSDMDVTLPIGEDGLTVGRAPDCDLVLHSAAVSRRHLFIETKQGMVCVKDLGSTNHTVDVCGTLLTLVGPPTESLSD